MQNLSCTAYGCVIKLDQFGFLIQFFFFFFFFFLVQKNLGLSLRFWRLCLVKVWILDVLCLQQWHGACGKGGID